MQLHPCNEHVSVAFVILLMEANSLRSNNGKFSHRMIKTFIGYVTNVYPQGVKACKLLDSLSMHIMRGGSFTTYWPAPDILEELSSYMQVEEKEMNEFKEDWIPVESRASLVSSIFC
jgi:hypothetical protein